MNQNLFSNLGLTPNRPWMTPSEIAIVKQILITSKQDVKVLEYGCGFSSIYFSKMLKDLNKNYTWHSVESNRQWYLKIKQLAYQESLDNMHLHLVDFNGQRPAEDEFPIQLRDEYIMKLKDLGADFDFVIVDGRFRKRCVNFVMENTSNCLVLLHDAEREKYQFSDCKGDSLVIDTGVSTSLQRRKLKRLFVASTSTEKFADFQRDVLGNLDIDSLNRYSERLHLTYTNKFYTSIRKFIVYGTKLVTCPRRGIVNAGHKIQKIIGLAH